MLVATQLQGTVLQAPVLLQIPEQVLEQELQLQPGPGLSQQGPQSEGLHFPAESQ